VRVAALSIDAQVLRDLPLASREARVHSVFERVINLRVGEDRLLTLAYRDADDAPDSVVVDLASWSGLGLAAGDRVRLHDWRIVIDGAWTGGLTIALDSARPWHGGLPAFAADQTTLRRQLPRALAHLKRHGRGVSTVAHPPGTATALEAALADAFRRHTQGLCAAIADGDNVGLHVQVGRLVGLGPGLTPAGDDYLVGLLAALHLAGGRCTAGRGVAACVVECAHRQTHLISAAALRAAARGRVRERVIELCDALMHGSSAGLAAALQRVVAIGSGSGSEIAAGVLAGFDLQLRAGAPGVGRSTTTATTGELHAL
jgi:hypothetical protein